MEKKITVSGEFKYDDCALLILAAKISGCFVKITESPGNPYYDKSGLMHVVREGNLRIYIQADDQTIMDRFWSNHRKLEEFIRNLSL